MASKWMKTLKSKWRRVSGAAAVLLMFFVPITKAVLANAGQARHPANQRGGNNGGHSDRSCASDRTPPTPSSVSRVRPDSSDPRTHGSRSGGGAHGGRGAGHGPQADKPKAK